jgi:NTP pyrophosphatase (non-canonical NTP hydrolase)
MSDPLTLEEFLDAVQVGNDWLDSDVSPEYLAQPLAHLWSRVTKICEEAGEVWKALSRWTGENPRKGVSGTKDDLLAELGDTASGAILAIQHLTSDTAVTWEVVCAALEKVRRRAAAGEALLEKDLEVSVFPAPSEKAMCAVRITHVPTGLFGDGAAFSELVARADALRQLRPRLEAYQKSERRRAP